MCKRVLLVLSLLYPVPFFLTGTMLRAQGSTLPPHPSGGEAPMVEVETDSAAPKISAGVFSDSGIPNASKPRSAQVEDALAVLNDLLRQYRESGDRQAEAGILGAIANSHNVLRQQQRSIEDLQAALVIWRELGNRKGEALTLAHIGDVYRGWGFPEQASRYYQNAIAIYPPADKRGYAATLNNLGLTYFLLHNRKKCLENLNEALAAYRALGDRHGEALALSNLGTTYNFLASDPEKALGMFQEAVTKLELLDDRSSEANALDNLGAVWLNLHKPEMAGLSFQRAIVLYQEIGDAQGQAAVRKHLSAVGEQENIAAGR